MKNSLLRLSLIMSFAACAVSSFQIAVAQNGTLNAMPLAGTGAFTHLIFEAREGSKNSSDYLQRVSGDNKAGEIDGFVGMYGYLRASGVGAFTIEAVFAFDDGSYTKDIAGVMTDGIAVSRASQPKDWGLWQGTAKALELKDWNDKKFKKKRRSFQVQPGSADQRLDRCYSKIKGGGSAVEGGVGVYATSTVCFFDNGRFTNDRAVWSQGASGDSTTVSPQEQGRYSISGHVAEFVYDDGVVVHRAFGFTEPNDPSQIWLNSSVYLD